MQLTTLTVKYDNAGNLTEKVTPNLAKVGRAITYDYDGFNRLTGISYDLGMTTPIRHTYGKADDVHHGAGRIIATHDESGDIIYEYGLLGELTAKTRSIARLSAGAAPVSATFGYVSDYLGRMHSITYPDGEVVTYTYDAGGQITHVEGNRHGTATAYIEAIRYDEFGQRSYIEYNDGKVNTSYTYDPYRRWLTAIATRGEGLSLQNISYSFDTVGNILGTTNSTYPSNMDGSITSQAYSYDSLYRLTNVTGNTARYVGTIERYTGSYSQSFTFDSQGLGNLTNKTSTQTTTPNIAIGQNLRYSFGYSYSATKPHQPTQIGDIHYDYDDNGNMVAEYTQARDSGTVTAPTVTTDDTGMSSMPLGIGIAVTDPYSVNGYIRRFGWNEENQLVWSNDGNNVVTYRYGADGERTLKYRSSSESLYFDSMWTCQTDGGSLRESKHIFVGQTRIATRLSIRGHADNSYPLVNTYYYHGDHLGSAQTVTDYRGALYERLEYTPYGELWVEQKTDTDPVAKIPYRFTGKEYDTETGLYAFGARYLNPVTGMWISADLALLDGSFLPVAPVSDEARKKNSNLPGMGGVFNGLNFGAFTYSHANPIKYVDPDGNQVIEGVLQNPGAAEPLIGGIIRISPWTAVLSVMATLLQSDSVHANTRVKSQNHESMGPVHHIATNKNSDSNVRGGPWTPRFEKLFAKGGLNLDILENKWSVSGHAGPHPEEYHALVYNALDTAINSATNGLEVGSDEYTKAAEGAIKSTLIGLGVACATPGTPLNLMITKGKPEAD